MPCPGSVRMEAAFPETDTHPMTLEGEAIHEVAAEMIQAFIDSDRKRTEIDRAPYLGKVTGNGTVISAEMLDVAEVYVRDVMSTSTRFNGLAKVLLEHRVCMPAVHPENWGTLDAAIVFFDVDARDLVISDLKAGWGIVEVWDNWQLINYTIGLLHEMGHRNWPLPEFVELRLCQPRPRHPEGKVRVQRIALADLEPYVARMRASALDAFSPQPTLQTGRHCDHCRARHACPALLNAGYRIVEVVKGISTQVLTGAALGAHLDMLDEVKILAKALHSALEDQALIEIQQGRSVPGWEWGQKESRKKWTVPVDQVHAMGDLYGVDLREVSAPTPIQAVSKGLPNDVVDTISARERAGFELRRANLKLAAKIFKPTE